MNRLGEVDQNNHHAFWTIIQIDVCALDVLSKEIKERPATSSSYYALIKLSGETRPTYLNRKKDLPNGLQADTDPVFWS